MPFPVVQLLNRPAPALHPASPDPEAWLRARRFVDANPALLAAFGIEGKAELRALDPPFLRSAHGDDGVLVDAWAAALQAGVYRYAWTHRNDDGAVDQHEVTLTAAGPATHDLVHVRLRDLGPQLRGEQALRRSEMLLGALQAVTSDAVLLIDVGRVVYSNTAAAALFGSTPGTPLDGTSLERLMPQFQAGGLSSNAQFDSQVRTACDGIVGAIDWELCRLDDDVATFAAEMTLQALELDGRRLVQAVIRNIGLRKAENELRHLAFHDALTGLANRRQLLERLRRSLVATARNGLSGAVLVIDLDKFKAVNDGLGRPQGDLLLQQVAARLQACTRASDTLARLDGDEFVVVLKDLSSADFDAAVEAEAGSAKVLAELQKPYLLDGVAWSVTASIGIVAFGRGADTAEELIQRADLAMVQAKAAGGNATRFFDATVQDAVTQRARLAHDLRLGLQRGEFVLHYQPQVGRGMQVTGAEALVRWCHPQRGMVSPAQFIPLAEETGLILPLGLWVLETACLQQVAWSASPATRTWGVAVNVSALQFRTPDFVDQVQQVIARTGADPHRLKLELTESLMLRDIEDIIAKMAVLQGIGVEFSLDDFGTGYSSLSYLKRLPLNQLKIDQSFVRDVLTDPNDAAIARTIVALSRSMGLTVIAEGVETAQQQGWLARNGCHDYQGYYFSRPLTAEAMTAFTVTAMPDDSRGPVC